MLWRSLHGLGAVLKWLFGNVVGLIRGRPRPRPLLDVGPYQTLYEGVYCLYRPDGVQPVFDVVFIHGLRVGSGTDQWLRTWTTRDGTQSWPQAWLPKKFPAVRVLALSYDSAATEWSGNPRKLWENAIDLLNGLVDPAVGLGDRPYFLVGHSMGGLLAKELLLRADQRNDSPGLRDNCLGIVFYGVPHLGAGAADLASLFNRAFGNIGRPTVFVTDELKLLGEACYQRNLNFSPLQQRYPSQNFIETATTKGVMVVPKEIAGFNTGAANMALIENANHSEVCKPSLMTDRNFAMFVTFLQRQLAAAGNLQ